MTQVFTPNTPIQNNYDGTGTVLGTGGITSAGQTSIPLNRSNLMSGHGITGLTAPNFSVKAMTPPSSSGTLIGGKVTITGRVH
jgi:hypothetical protein